MIEIRFWKSWIDWWRQSTLSTGARGERLAETFLKRQGMTILARNYHNRFGEIDLIVRDGPAIVFVEVRSRSSTSHGSPVETVNRGKQQKLSRAATGFVQAHRLWNTSTRFDVVAIVWGKDGTAPKLDHFKDAFQAQ